MDKLHNISRPAFLATVLLIAGLAFARQQQNFPGATVSAAAGGTTNGLPKFTSPTALGNSSLTDNGTTVSTGEPLTLSIATGTAPLAISSTTAVANLTATNHPQVQSCGTTSTCSHTALGTSQIVMGSAPLVSGTPSAVTITGINPAFTSTSTYFCVQTDETTTASALVTFSKVSGSSFTITGPATNTDTISYVCVGN